MSEDHYVNEFFRQAAAFEKLETAFNIGERTENNLVMGQVCKRLAEVCMMLAEERCNEVEKKEAEGDG
jgi:hypothetical protein